MNKSTREYERELFGGKDAGELHIDDHGDGPCATMFLMDAEYDPLRLSFNGDGDVTFHTKEQAWVKLLPDQLRFIAMSAEKGAAMTRACYTDDGEERTGGEQ